jgi:hypothetical protein
MQQQATAEINLAQQMTEPTTTPTNDSNQNLVDVFKQLTRVMRDNNTSDDATIHLMPQTLNSPVL